MEKNGGFRERMTSLSLEFREIRPSEFVRTRSKAALREEAYAWTPVLGSFVKLRGVGVSPYLGFTLYLSILQCFGWFEALNGRLIGSKSWNRSVWDFETHRQSVSVLRAVWVVNCVNYEINHVLVCMRPKMAVKFGFTK